MAKHKSHHKNSNDLVKLINDHEEGIGYTFLGVGLVMFLLNISQFLSTVPVTMPQSWVGPDLSLFASILLIILSVFFLTESHK